MNSHTIYHFFKNNDIDNINLLKKKFSNDEIIIALYNVIDDIPPSFLSLLNSDFKELKTKRQDHSLRSSVISRDRCCILSGLYSDFCDVAHIIPFCDASPADKYNPDNCFLLSKNIHCFFDKFLWSINPDTSCVVLSNKLLDDPVYNMQSFHNKFIPLSFNQKYFLKSHYHNFISQ